MVEDPADSNETAEWLLEEQLSAGQCMQQHFHGFGVEKNTLEVKRGRNFPHPTLRFTFQCMPRHTTATGC